MDKKENTIMRYGKFSTMMQQQKEDEAQKLMDKEQRAMTSTPTGKALIIIQPVLYLHHFLQSSIPHKLGVSSKITTLATDSMFSSQIVYSIYKRFVKLLGNSTLDVG